METLYTALHTALYTIVIYAVSYLAGIYSLSYGQPTKIRKMPIKPLLCFKKVMT